MQFLKYARTWKRSRHLVVPIWLLLLLPFNAVAAQYWVSAADGDDASDGLAIDRPFATVSKCADTAVAGDVCIIRAGTYREVLRPAATGQPGSPITFKAQENEVVTISGADIITPGESGFGQWEQEPGSANIHHISLPAAWVIPTSEAQPFSSQVFVSDTMMTEARWPDFDNPNSPKRDDYAISTSGQYLGNQVGDFGEGEYQHPGLKSFSNDQVNFFVGAKIVLVPGKEWGGSYGTVFESSEDIIKFSYRTSGQARENTIADDPFMLWGKREFLDTANEYFLDETNNTLYVCLEDGADPNMMQFTMKRREKTVDLDSRNYIHLEGLRFFAGYINVKGHKFQGNMVGEPIGIVLDRIRSEYGYHHMYRIGGSDSAAVTLHGTDNSLINSEILKSASHAIDISGSNLEVSNNVIHEIGYIPALFDGIQVFGAEDTRIERNSVYSTSSLGISAATLKRGRIVNNRIFDVARQKTDIAALNSWNSGDGEGTEIAWNIVHDALGYKDDSSYHNGAMGIRLDSGGGNPRVGNSNYLIHHNLVYNTTKAGITIWAVPANAPNYGNSGNIVVNNTMDGPLFVTAGPGTSIAGTVIANNVIGGYLSYAPINIVPDTNTTHNNLVGYLADWQQQNNNTQIANAIQNHNVVADPQFINPEQYDFRLDAGSPGIDMGLSYSPLTNGYSGSAPDMGAFEQGTPPFSAGASLLPENLAGLWVNCQNTTDSVEPTCRITGFPPGRFPGADFSLRVGSSGAPVTCTPAMDRSNWDISALCDTDLNGGSAPQQLYVSLDGSEFIPVNGLPGDITCDGTVDHSDALGVLKTLADSGDHLSPCSWAGADMDGDDRFGLADAIHALGVAAQ